MAAFDDITPAHWPNTRIVGNVVSVRYRPSPSRPRHLQERKRETLHTDGRMKAISAMQIFTAIRLVLDGKARLFHCVPNVASSSCATRSQSTGKERKGGKTAHSHFSGGVMVMVCAVNSSSKYLVSVSDDTWGMNGGTSWTRDVTEKKKKAAYYT